MRKKELLSYLLAGAIPVVWLGLLIAPLIDGGLVRIVSEFPDVIASPFSVTLVEGSFRTVLIFLLAYAMGIGIDYSTKRNYRRGEEMGSAKWGDALELSKKYKAKSDSDNKILTQNVKIGLDGRKHRRNLNVMVCGGSGSGKTRFYAKPNIMQANTSMMVLDPNS